MSSPSLLLDHDFGWAVRALKSGERVRRRGWNGYLMMFTAQGDFVPWLASQTDVLAEDWELAS